MCLPTAGRYPVPDKVFQPLGCLECRNTGFLGRTGIYEMMKVSPRLRGLISAQLDLGNFGKAALSEGMRPLRISAADQVAAGLTTVQEILTVSATDREHSTTHSRKDVHLALELPRMKPVLIIRTGRAPDPIRGRHGDFPHWFRIGTRLLPQQSTAGGRCRCRRIAAAAAPSRRRHDHRLRRDGHRAYRMERAHRRLDPRRDGSSSCRYSASATAIS
jgi:hypothetical protein